MSPINKLTTPELVKRFTKFCLEATKPKLLNQR